MQASSPVDIVTALWYTLKPSNFSNKNKKTSSKLLFQKLKTIKKIKSERERERGKTLKKRQRWNEALGGVRVLCTVYIYRLRFKSARVFILALPYLCFFFNGPLYWTYCQTLTIMDRPTFPSFFFFSFSFFVGGVGLRGKDWVSKDYDMCLLLICMICVIFFGYSTNSG